MFSFFYFCFAVLIFTILFFGIYFFKKDALFVVGIGSIIAANIYTSLSFPIEFWGLIFGMDGIIYTVFIFCMLLMFIDYGEQSTKAVFFSAISSTLLTALFAFCGHSLSSEGGDASQIAIPYVFSVIASIFAVFLMIWLYKFFSKKNFNKYLNISISLICGNLINSIVYFSFSSLFNGVMDNYFQVTIGSVIGKMVSIVLCLVFVVIFELLKKKKNNISVNVDAKEINLDENNGNKEK